MGDADSKAFWNQQKSSLHRSEDDAFYARKAAEHASLLTADEKAAGAVDLGCGAGELLYFLIDHINVRQGLDYSQSMLDQARIRLEGKGVELEEADFRKFLPDCSQPVWLTTGALNQYLNPSELNGFLDLFVANPRARALFLFDCVDPMRFLLLPYGIRYRTIGAGSDRSLKALAMPAYRLIKRVGIGLQMATGHLFRNHRTLRIAAMGHGYLPRFWLEAAAKRDLSVEIVSSRFYEYRYHALIRKSSCPSSGVLGQLAR